MRTKFLEPEEEDLIHEQSLKSLRELGVRVHSPSVLGMLHKAGADVDPKTEIAKIPESMVKDALARAPKRIRYAARDPKHDFEIPSATWPFLATNGLAIHIADIDTGKDHPSTREDLARFQRLADAVEQVDYLWTSMTPCDVPQMAHGVHEVWITLQNTVKHVEGVTILSGEDARVQIELAALVAGGREELRKNPILSVISCPIAPLTFERGAVEAQIEYARAGVPILSMSMSLGGMTAPVTLAGTIANVNTENLASLVISQVAAPGCPHIYTSDSTPANMATGYIDYNSVEAPLISAGAVQMARRYGLPCMTSGWGASTEPGPGLRAPFSEITGIFLSVLAGTDLSAGVGGVDTAKGASYEQVIIDAYVWEDLRAFMRRFTVDEESIALDVVREVGHGNSFLKHPHTARHFRKELFFRDPKKLAWEATLSDRMVPEARAIARRLLKEHTVPALDKAVVKEGEAIIRAYERRLAGA